MTFDVRLYFSGTPGGAQNIVDSALLDAGAFRLSTFAYPKEALHYLSLAESKQARTSMIIDSGAFTAWSVGSPVALRDLIDYNKKILSQYGESHGFMFISLDVIPGERGRRATSDEINKAVDQSIDNFKIMQQEFPGHYVLPVYHSGEDVWIRNKYMEMTDYVCLSMDQGMSEHSRVSWARRVHVDGYKFHGLAATGNRMVTEIPWFSVDSSSWLTVGSMGNLLWDNGRGGFRVLSVSSTSPLRHEQGAHVDTLTELERDVVIGKLEAEGFDLEKLREEYAVRHLWNIRQWLNPPWKANYSKVQELF